LQRFASKDVQQREEHWIFADLVGKGRHTRGVPVPNPVKKGIDEWTQATSVQAGPLLQPINKAERIGEASQGSRFKPWNHE
jgi:hypothetical protein